MAHALVKMEVSQKQAYIFSSNKLKNNVSNSEDIAWIMDPEYFELIAGESGLFVKEKNLVYSGGGHIVLEFEEKEKTTAFGIVLVGPAKGSHDDFTFLTLPAWAKENQSLTEATRSTKEYLEKAAGQRQVNGISVPAVMEAVPSVFDGGTPYVRLAILCAYYLASKNPDVRLETSKKRNRPVFVFQGKAQRINVKAYTVGENAAKEYKKNGEGKTPRWRHYWCGNGRERRECKFIY